MAINKRYLLMTTKTLKPLASTTTSRLFKATDVLLKNEGGINNKNSEELKNLANKLKASNPNNDDFNLVNMQKARHVNKSFLSKWYFLASISVFAALLMYSVLKDDEEDSESSDSDQVPLLLMDENGNLIKTRRQKVTIFANDWMFFFYSTLPLNAVSRVWGQLNSLTLPVTLRPLGYKFYSYCFGVDMNEMDDPVLENYKNLSEFFYRTIKPECRPISPVDELIMPSDGKVLQLGEIDPLTGEIEQVKGITYNVKEFLGTHSHPLMNKSVVEYTSESNNSTLNEETALEAEELDLEKGLQVPHAIVKGETSHYSDQKHLKVLKDLMHSEENVSKQANNTDKKFMFVVIYLAPGDYHHYHSPADWLIKIRRHFPGQLYSVSPYFQKNFKNLFILNERVSLLGNWKHGFFSMTPVGATNVGSIKLNFDKDLITNYNMTGKNNKSVVDCYEATYWNKSPTANNNEAAEGIPIVKGEEMGGFMLGSTVVLCFEAPKNFQFDCKLGDKVKMGQRLGHFTSEHEVSHTETTVESGNKKKQS
ncbi:hypothetical protein QEN19_004271 [Hanseniaspora menglaensis]